MHNQINPLHTCCKKCVFSIYDNKTQIGCHLDYLDRYKKSGAEILDVYDDDLEFNVINNKKCLGYREDYWFAKYPGDLDISKKIDLVKQDLYIKYLLVLDLKFIESKDTLNKISEQISGLKYKPNKIIIIRYKNQVLEYGFNVIYDFLKMCLPKTPWRIQTIEDDNAKFESILHGITSINKKHRFIVSLQSDANLTVLGQIIEKANSVVYDELSFMHAISDHDSKILLYSAPSYRFLLHEEGKDLFTDQTYHIKI